MLKISLKFVLDVLIVQLILRMEFVLVPSDIEWKVKFVFYVMFMDVKNVTKRSVFLVEKIKS